MRYRQTLIDLRDLFAQHEVKVWPELLSRWIDELDLSGTPSRDHVVRTKNATTGPGRLDDIFICARNGHRVAGGDEERATNDRLRKLLDDLNEETSRLLKT